MHNPKESGTEPSERWKLRILRAIVRSMRGLNIGVRQLERLLRRRGATAEDAEDLVQEAIVRLFVYTRNAGEVRNTEAFLTRTALNLAVDLHRSSRSDRYERESIELMDLVDLAPMPDEVLAAEQRLLSMRDCLDRVSEIESIPIAAVGQIASSPDALHVVNFFDRHLVRVRRATYRDESEIESHRPSLLSPSEGTASAMCSTREHSNSHAAWHME